jgi:xylulokinase
MQILADVLDISVVQLESGSGAGYGIALTAAANSTAEISMEDILQHTVSTKKTFYPRSYNAKLYNQKYRKYLRIYSALKHIY